MCSGPLWGTRHHTQDAARLDLAAEIYEDHDRSRPCQQLERTGRARRLLTNAAPAPE